MGGKQMKRRVFISIFMFAGMSLSALAQQPGSTVKLNRTQIEGRLLFNQHCGVCHSQPTILSPYYGPALSKELVGNGNGAAVRQFISEGTDRMPGFRLSLTPSQIDAIVRYLTTVPPSANQKPKPAQPTSRGSQRELD
jgi:mono/diheme cytochrome c family protein